MSYVHLQDRNEWLESRLDDVKEERDDYFKKLEESQAECDELTEKLAAAEERAENFDRQLFGIATVLEPLARHSNLTEAARDLVARLLADEADRDALRAERDNWIETARTYAKGEDYYRSMIDAALSGIPAAFVADDGSVSDSPLRAKFPEIIAAERADRDALIAEVQRWREGRAYLGVPMTYVDQRLVDETRRFIGDKRAAGVKP